MNKKRNNQANPNVQAALQAARAAKGAEVPQSEKEVIENLQEQLVQSNQQAQILERTANNVADQRNRAQNELAQVSAQAGMLGEQLQSVRTALESKTKELEAKNRELGLKNSELEKAQVALIELQEAYDKLDADSDDDEIEDEYEEDEDEEELVDTASEDELSDDELDVDLSEDNPHVTPTVS